MSDATTHDADSPAVHFEEFLANAGHDSALAAELAAIFRDDLPRVMADLRVSVEQADAGQLERAAHRLRGSLATLGARTARDMTSELEHLGRRRALDGTPGRLADLERELARVFDALDRYPEASAP